MIQYNIGNSGPIIFSKHYGYRSRGLRVVKRSEKLWEIQNYPLPGQPFTHHWVKSKTICHFLRNFDAFLNGFWFYSIVMSIFEFLTKFLVFWHPCPDTPGCASVVIWNHCSKQIWAISPTVSLLHPYKASRAPSFLYLLAFSSNLITNSNLIIIMLGAVKNIDNGVHSKMFSFLCI